MYLTANRSFYMMFAIPHFVLSSMKLLKLLKSHKKRVKTSWNSINIFCHKNKKLMVLEWQPCYRCKRYGAESSEELPIFLNFVQNCSGFRQVGEKCMALVEMWKKLQHSSVVQLREVFTSNAFGEHCKTLSPPSPVKSAHSFIFSTSVRTRLPRWSRDVDGQAF